VQCKENSTVNRQFSEESLFNYVGNNLLVSEYGSRASTACSKQSFLKIR
jgi:hypothetical protein